MENTRYDVNTEKFSGKKAFGFAMTRASSILSSLLIGEITYFATNSIGVAAAAISIGLAVKTTIDAVTDLFMGALIDKTHTKYGKARPYTLAGILVWICILGIFCVPVGAFANLSGNAYNIGVTIYISVLATLASAVFETMRGCAYDTHLKRSIVNDNNRIKVMTIGGVIFSIGSLGMQVVLPMIINIFNGSQKGFMLLALVMSVLGIVASVCAFIFCEEYTDEELSLYGGFEVKKEEKVTIKEFLKSVANNKYVIKWTLINFLIMALINGSFIVGQYYFQYVFGDLGSMSIVMASSAAAFPVMFFIPKLCDKFGVVNCIRVTLIIAIFGVILRMFMPHNSIIQCVGYLCASMPQIPMAFVGSQVTIECMEYGRYKTGVVVEAMYSSFTNFAQKMSGSVYQLLLGIVLSVTGFDLLTDAVKKAGVADWSELTSMGSTGIETYVSGGMDTVNHAVTGINIMYNVVPLVVMILISVLMLSFNLEKELKELRKKHGVSEN